MIQPVKPITQAYYRRQNPYVLYQCEACGKPGKVTRIGEESHLLCPNCIGYMDKVKAALPTRKQKPTLVGKMQEKFERMADRIGMKALAVMESMSRYEKVCWVIILGATTVILGNVVRWCLR